jgi:hypothetical protein
MVDPMRLSDQALEAEFRLFWASETALSVGPAAHTLKLAVAWGRHLLEQQAAKPLE